MEKSYHGMHPPRPSSLGGWGKDFRKVFAGRGQKGLFWWEVILLEGGGGFCLGEGSCNFNGCNTSRVFLE